MSDSLLSNLNDAIGKIDNALVNVFAKLCEDMTEIRQRIEKEKELERLEAEIQAMRNEADAEEIIPFDVMMEKLEAFDRETHDITKQEAVMFWGEDAQLFSEKMAARVSEATRAMENESARRAMKRRKLLHAEGHFPDMACGL